MIRDDTGVTWPRLDIPSLETRPILASSHIQYRAHSLPISSRVVHFLSKIRRRQRDREWMKHWKML